jgi:xanthine dehydrogenase YagS FAD-binding subunit
MHAFELIQAASGQPAKGPGAIFMAGGTDILQLMKSNVIAPDQVIDIAGENLRGIKATATELRLGALETMADVAAHADVKQGWPAISQALLLSASPQVRNMGTMGGNLLQRTRCLYFRDTSFACNKRNPGSGCPAIAGENRELGILGTSDSCIATHPSDFPVALMALGAHVAITGPDGASRSVALADFYRLPGDTPQIETAMRPGDVITEIVVPASEAAKRSAYVKVRDRTSFAFALVAAAVAIEIRDNRIHHVGIALGGVAPMPWRAAKAEQALMGAAPDDATFERAGKLATEGAKAAGMNGFKIELAQRAVTRALTEAAHPDAGKEAL